MITTDQIREAQTGCSMGQAPVIEVGMPSMVLPKSCRAACAVALNGFHSATCWRNVGIPVTGTNALEMKVSGKSQIRPPEVAASGVRTDRPISAPI
jgi:hypothetical protein